MTISAFGVDHGEVSKAAALVPFKPRATMVPPNTPKASKSGLSRGAKIGIGAGAAAVGGGAGGYAYGRNKKVSKAKREPFTSREKNIGAAAGALAYTPFGAAPAIYGGAKANKGKRVRTGANALGRGILEGTGGGLAGQVVGGAVSRGRLTQLGRIAGGGAASAHGTAASLRNSRKKGWTKG